MTTDVHTYYGYDFCVGGYFEMPTRDARSLLPKHLEPLEVMHDRSILAVTAFHFNESLVGEYDEVVLAVVVPPIIEPGRPLPKAAFYPFIVGTSTPESREHAIERWRLPHYMSDLAIGFDHRGDEMVVTVTDSKYKVDILMEAEHNEHEEETGSLELHEHPMTEGLTLDEVNTYPFREEWYTRGRQVFDPMVSF
jgi:hypothetical protein